MNRVARFHTLLGNAAAARGIASRLSAKGYDQSSMKAVARVYLEDARRLRVAD